MFTSPTHSLDQDTSIDDSLDRVVFHRRMSIERSTGKKEYLKQKAYHRAPMNLSLRISCLLAAIIGVASSKGSVSVLYRRVVSTTAACLLPLCIAPPIVTAASTAPKVSAVSSSVDLATQLKNMQTAQEALDAQDVEYTLLPLGESYREFRVGRGSRSVEQGSPVTAEMTIRCAAVRVYCKVLSLVPNIYY